MILAYDLTFQELLESKVGVVTAGGYLIGGPDRKQFLADPAGLKTAWLAWQKDCQKAEELYPKVQEYFQRTKHLTKPPKDESEIKPDTTNYTERKEEAKSFNPPQFTWSYSSLDSFTRCAYNWAALKFYKTVKDQPNEMSLWGTRIHKALECYLLEKDDPDIATVIDMGFNKYADIIKKSSIGGKLLVEQQFCIDRNMNFVDWYSESAWGRGVVDVAIIKDDTIFIYDWKLGNNIKNSEDQLITFCFFLALKFPRVESFMAKFIWLKHDKTTGFTEKIKKVDLMPKFKALLDRVKVMEEHCEHKNFPQSKNFLCKRHCPVSHCPHCG